MAKQVLLLLVVLWLLLLQSLPSNADTTQNLINPSDIQGTYNNCTPGVDCWNGTTGGSRPNWDGTTAYWGYGAGQLSWELAMEQALREAGINVDGYNYVWRVKNFDTNSPQNDGNDYMRISVRFYDASGNQLWGKQYNLDGHYGWTNFSGQELFTSPLTGSSIDSIILRAEGDDIGFWAGYYGPEFNVSGSSVSLIYSNDPCYPDPIVDPTCDGYAEAYALQMLEEQMAAIETTPEPVIQEQTYEEPITVQDTDIQNSQTNPTEQVEISTSERTEDEEEAKVDPIEIALNAAADDAAFILNNIVNGELGGISSALENNQTQTSMGVDNAQTQSQGSSSSNQNDSEEKETQGQKLKRAAKERAAGLQKEIVESDDIDEQQAQQQEMLAMMNYVPGFDAYKIALAGGTYPDVAFYAPTTIPDSKEGARNNFAQQLLHQQMVDMQYQ